MMWKTLLAILLISGTVARAEEALKLTGGAVLLKFGVVELEDAAGKKTEYKKEGESGEFPDIILRQGETLRVREHTDCDVVFPEAGAVRVEPKSAIKIPAEGGKEAKGATTSLELLGGKLFLDIDGAKLATKKKQFRLKTPTAILAVKGTRFFAEVGDGIDTAGVNHGKVQMVEPGSGKSLLINSGSAAMAKNGMISKPRRLTAEEVSYGEIYKDFAVEFEPGERTKRRFKAVYEAQVTPDSAIPTEFPKLIKAEKSTELETGTAVKITILPLPGEPTASIFAKTTVDIPVRLGSEPVGITFMARGTDIRRFSISGSLKLRNRVFAVSREENPKFPEGTLPDEWVLFFVPLKEIVNIPTTEPGSFTFSIDPNIHAGRAVTSIVQVEEGKSKYILEISPLILGVRPKE